MLKNIYRYIIRSYLGPLVLTFTISLFILVMQFLWKYIDDLVGKGLDWFIIMELLFYAAATFVPLALPLAILFASLMTFGNLGERYELLAMKAAGISLSNAMKPLVFLSLLISLSAFFFSNNVLPVANLKMFTLLNDVRQKKPAVNIRPGIFYNEIEGLVIKVSSKDKDGKGVSNIFIYDYTNPEAMRYNGLNFTTAKRGIIEMSEDDRYMTLTLVDGVNYFEKIEGRDQYQSRPLQRTSFARQMRTIDLSAFTFSKTNEEFFKDDFRMLSIRQLNGMIDSMYGDFYREKEMHIRDMIRIFRNLYADTLATVRIQTVVPDSANGTDQADTPSSIPSTTGIDRLPPEVREGYLSHKHLRDVMAVRPADPGSPADTASDGRKSYTPLVEDTLRADLLTNFLPPEQSNIVTTALQLSRSAKENMNNRNMMITNRMRLIRKYEIEWHRKFTLSIACLILFFIGAPLGAIIRKGGLGMPAVLSVVLFIIFHVLSMTGDKLARESTVTPAAGMWMASLIILPVGIFLTVKATSDAALLDAETYGKTWKRLIRRDANEESAATDQ